MHLFMQGWTGQPYPHSISTALSLWLSCKKVTSSFFYVSLIKALFCASIPHLHLKKATFKFSILREGIKGDKKKGKLETPTDVYLTWNYSKDFTFSSN